MSKIRNLFNKIRKKNNNDQDIENIFIDDDDTPNIPENIEVDIDEHFDDEFEDDDITREIDLPTGHSDDGTAEHSQDGDYTSEIDLNDDHDSIKDRFHHIATRLQDRFRRHNKKDLTRDQLTDVSQVKNLKAVSKKIGRVNFTDIPINFFKQTQFPGYHRKFQITVIILGVFASAKIATLFLQGVPDYNQLNSNSLSLNTEKAFTKNDLQQIKTANIFRTDKTEIKTDNKPAKETPLVCKEASKKSSLPIKLVNTIVLQDSVKSIASVQVRSSSKLEVFRQGQKIGSLAKLDYIDDEKLIIKNLKTGFCESIQSSAGKKRRTTRLIKPLTPSASRKFKKEKKTISGIINEGNNFEINRSFLKDKMKNISSLLTQAKGIPINNPDGTISFKVTQIDPGGVFAYLGQQEGDIITQINGEPIKDLNEVMTLFGTITNVSNLSLTLKRNGEEVQQNYSVK